MKIVLIAASFLISPGCSLPEKNTSEELKQQIINADKLMCEMAARNGFNNSILFYADNNIVKLSEGKLPIIGKAAFAASYDTNSDVKTISWTPVNAKVSESGELGYTWGNWKFIANDTVFYGNYFTVWKKQSDGNWKVVLDGGNTTPKPDN